jgi:hypothetical protein
MTCTNCGTTLKDGAKFCAGCGASYADPAREASLNAKAVNSYESGSIQTTQNQVPLGQPGSGQAITKRYADAYKVAKTVVGIGTLIKIIGAVAGGLIALVSMGLGGVIAQAAFGGGNAGAGVVFFVMGLFYGGLVFALFYICGVILSAQGQILQAGLDTAVNTSPFVNDHQKARIMSLA